MCDLLRAPHCFPQPQRDPVVKPARELRELLDFFNIDVAIPSVVMTQDKARNFATTNNDRDIFNLYYSSLEFDKTHKALEDAKFNVEVARADVHKAKEQHRVCPTPLL